MFKRQPNFNSINIWYFVSRTFKLDAFNPDLILVWVTLPFAYCYFSSEFDGPIVYLKPS